MNSVQIVTTILSVGTVAGDIFIVLFLISWSLGRKTFHKKIFLFLNDYGIGLALAAALIATLGSLFFSEIALYSPCKLCWLQRIFMYPQVLLLGIAWWHGEKGIKKYSIPLAVIGGLIALYHYSLQRFPDIFSAACGVGEQVNCTTNYSFTYHYITIPMMALTAFILIIICLASWQRPVPVMGDLAEKRQM